jgi:O-methyltransferase
MQALDALYRGCPPGVFCIIDDYKALKSCRKAVSDYRAKHGVSAEIVEIDGTGVLWRK